jgi:hypothetical protein
MGVVETRDRRCFTLNCRTYLSSQRGRHHRRSVGNIAEFRGLQVPNISAKLHADIGKHAKHTDKSKHEMDG